MLRGGLASKKSYQTSTSSIKLRLPKLQAQDYQAHKIRSEKLELGQGLEVKKNCGEIDEVLHQQGSLYISPIILTKLISGHYDDLLAGNFGIKKT